MGSMMTIVLAIVMVAIAVVNTALMAWLWRFPMKPDPTGRDPHGVSTAPRGPTNLHRALGYVFALVYLALLFEMVPRLWAYREWNGVSATHAALGLLVGVLLITKVAIIRRFRHLGNRLPWIGGSLAVTTLAVAFLGSVPILRLTRAPVALTPDLERGRSVVLDKCMQCHGASTIAFEDEDREKWDRITREMQRFSIRMDDKVAITDQERRLAALYLTAVLGEEDDDEDEDEDEEERKRDERERRKKD